MPDDPPDQVKPYLDEIAVRLWSNNAAVMVGAGFSHNAKSMGSTSASFPSWQELGDVFYKKLHGQYPSGEAKYLSLLKLAEQVEAAFGRPVLDDLLRSAIPDLRCEPSPLHSQLLNLPWVDVFTTNYDTLLERARGSVTLKHYDVVTTEEDLLHANAPRIVKLHGTLPSPPFVVTEEDYRRYPNDHAPFVNTVRQSLLENTLCLIGFSGDDPNFLQWIGWIRDHLGQEFSPKIYLVGMFDVLTEAERKLLDRRGIIAVDLSVFRPDSGEALGALLGYLKRRKPRTGDWPIISTDARSWAMRPDRQKFPEIVAEWRRQRTEYPGWVVMPEVRRRALWNYTDSWLSYLSQIPPSDFAGLETPLDLDLAFELAWRLERCLFPLMGELPTFLEHVATKYSDVTLPLPENAGWTRKSVFEAVANIRLWLLRYYREEGMEKKWRQVGAAVDFEELPPEHAAKLRLEEALQALFRFEPAEAKRLLVNWRSYNTPPFWQAKRAALMAELGEAAAAHSILETSLSAIRQQQSLTSVMEDYTLISQESIVMLLLWAIKNALPVTKQESEDSGPRDELSERWNELTRYRCDPRREIALLSARLRHPSVGWKQESKTPSFDLGMISKEIHLGTDEDMVAAYGLLRMYEDIGLPYRIENTRFVDQPVESTLSHIRPYSRHWAFVNFVRMGNAKAADGLFDREYLAGLGRNQVDGLFEIYLPAFERTIAMVNEPDWSEAKTFKRLAGTLPEIFSRLCYKCSPTYRERLVDALRAIYGSKRRQVFRGISHFAHRLFHSMSIKERTRAAASLIDIPMPDNLNEYEKQQFINPVLWVKFHSMQGVTLPVIAERIDELLDQFARGGEDRDWTATKLAWLHGLDKLSGQQSKRLGGLLWDGVEASSVPMITGICCSEYMKLPSPVEVDPEPRVKKQLRTIIDKSMKEVRFDEVLNELRDYAEVVKWSKAEAFELVATLSEWWNRNKCELDHQRRTLFGSPADDIERTVRRIINALSAVFSRLPAGQDQEESVESLREFLTSLEAHGIAAKRLEAAASGLGCGIGERVLERVTAAMHHKDSDVVGDALSAAEILAHTLPDEGSRDKFAPIGTALVQGVQWRHSPALEGRLRVIASLVKNQPWFLTVEALNSLFASLVAIAEETSTGVRGNDEDGMITIRASAASLAFALSEHWHKPESDEQEAIRRWREICGDPDEFSEVKNAWGVGG